ncbi:MAG: hypothetical protein JOZ57_15140 [Abitibacteriaceae bacterium]|nr:hypothetical protein [Abditibacteriaceae bacterium]
MLSNTEDDVTNLGMHILYQGIAPGPDIEAYEGHYELGPGHVITVTHEGSKLITQVTGDRKLWLVAKAADQFYNPGLDLDYTFVKDETGEVSGAIIHQHGQTWQARWISALTPDDLAPESATEHLSRPSPPLAPRELAKVAAIIDSYDGQYEVGPGQLITVTHEGTRLVAPTIEGHTVRLVPKSVNQFANNGLALEYTFIRDEAGAVTGVIVRQREQTLKAQRVPAPTPQTAVGIP